MYVIDPDGVEYFKKAYKGYKKPFVCYLDEPEETLIERMTKRGDDPEKIQSRIAHDREKFSDEIVQRMNPDKVYTSPFPISKDILSCIGMLYAPCGCDACYAADDEKKIDDAYHKYQYDWLLRHGYSIEDVLVIFAKYLVGKIMKDNSKETEQNMIPYIVSMVESFILDCGFNGECYACKNEFLDWEGKDLI